MRNVLWAQMLGAWQAPAKDLGTKHNRARTPRALCPRRVASREPPMATEAVATQAQQTGANQDDPPHLVRRHST